MNEKILALAVMAQDQASATLQHIERTLGALETRAGLAGRAMGAFGDVLRGIGMGVGIAAFVGIEAAVSRLVGLFPNLIEKGIAFAQTVHTLQLETGATAQSASLLAGEFQFFGVSLDGVAQKLAIFSKNVIAHAADLKALGISILDSSGHTADQITLFTRVQAALAGMQDGTRKTREEQLLFGRSMADLLPLLGMNADQVAMLTKQLTDAGVVMDDTAVKKARQADVAMKNLGVSMQGLGNTLASNLGPVIAQTIDNIASWINKNSANIAKFAENVINTIIGVIDGLFGLNIATVSFSMKFADATSGAQSFNSALDTLGNKVDKHKNSTKGATEAYRDQIQAIDALIAAVKAKDVVEGLDYTNAMARIHSRSDAEYTAATKALDAKLAAMVVDDTLRSQAATLEGYTQRGVGLQGQLTDATDSLTAAKQHLADAQNAVYSVDSAQLALDERSYKLSREDLVTRLAATTNVHDRMRAQLALDELDHRRAATIANEQKAEQAAAKQKETNVANAQKAVEQAQDAVAKVQAEQITLAAEIAKFEAQIAEQKVKDDIAREKLALTARHDAVTKYIDAIDTSESKWADKKKYLEQLKTDEAVLQSGIAAAKQSGDTQAVHDLTLELQAVETKEKRVQQQIRHIDREADLGKQKKQLQELMAAVSAASTGAPAGLGPQFAAAGAQAVASFGNMKEAGVGALTGKGGILDSVNVLHGTIEGPLQKAMEDVRLKGVAMGKAVGAAVQGITDIASGTITIIGKLSALIGGFDFTKLLAMGAAASALVGNIPLAFALAIAAGLSLNAGVSKGLGPTGNEPPGTPPPPAGMANPVWDKATGSWIDLKGFAGGGDLPSAGRFMVGERGPEMLEMYAGGGGRVSAGGSPVGGSASVNIAAGAIVIQGANASPDAIAEKVIYAIQRQMTRNGYTSMVAR